MGFGDCLSVIALNYNIGTEQKIELVQLLRVPLVSTIRSIVITNLTLPLVTL